MKTIALTFVASVFTLSALATNNDELKGPAAKNAKPWLNQTTSSIVVVEAPTAIKLMGPAMKNSKPWSDKNTTVTNAISSKAKSRLTGPAAKNAKPWNK